MEDAELARRAADGDRGAWAAIYDRYADRLYDYCHSILRDRDEARDAVHDAYLTAAAKIGQLRDPERLRSWLYAICRTTALARVRRRARETPSDLVAEMSPPVTDRDDYAETELRDLVWQAAAGLEARERAVLDLHLRHGLEGRDLADALGVNPHHATVLLSRVRGNVERSLSALLVGRTGRRDCPDLAALLTGWDGALSPLIRKRVARHIDRCEVCGQRKRQMVSPTALLSTVPLLPAPLALREEVLGKIALVSATGRPAGGAPRGRRWVGPAAAACVALAMLGGAITVYQQPWLPRQAGAPVFDAAPGGETQPSPTPAGPGSSPGLPAATGTGDAPSPGDGGSVARDARPPVIRDLVTGRDVVAFGDDQCATTTASAIVLDGSPVSVTLRWRHENGGLTHETEMSSAGGDRFAGTLGPPDTPGGGDIRWHVVATDAEGNAARSQERTLRVSRACRTPDGPESPELSPSPSN